MIIGAVLGLIGVITLLAGMSLLMGAAGVETGTELLLIALIPALLVVIFQLVTGIMGIKNSDKPEKAKVCIVLGAITLALALINTIIAIITRYECQCCINSHRLINSNILSGWSVPEQSFMMRFPEMRHKMASCLRRNFNSSALATETE